MSTLLMRAIVLAGILIVTACDRGASAGAAIAPIRAVAGSALAVEPQTASGDSATPSGLQYSLSEGSDQSATPAPLPRPSTQPLTDTETDALLRRLPALPSQPEDVQALALPPTSIPPPRTGATVQEPFPPPATPPPADRSASQPLEVLRFAPEGSVPLAANLSVTFNQPMVALTGLQDLQRNPPPVRISPQPAGQWRWVGTSTIVFEPDPRFPMATTYTAEIPAGTAAASGSTLASPVSWSFTTPPPQVLSFLPSGSSVPFEPLMAATFDQKIEPADVLRTIKVRAGATTASLRLATAEEIKADQAVSSLVQRAAEGRWIVFRALEPFPAATDVTVTFGPGMPSAEGPLTTSEAPSFSFRTYGPLVVTRSYCGWGGGCPPLSSWFVEFSNPLDTDAFDPGMVRITPELPGASIRAYSNRLEIDGRSNGRTTYQVVLSGQISDIYGQKLGADQTVSFSVGEAQPAIWSEGTPFVVLDPALPPQYSVFTVNFSSLDVKAYAVTPTDWKGFQDYLASYYREEKPVGPPGKLVLSRTVETAAQPDELTETSIDLSSALQDGKGNLVLIIKPQRGGLAGLLDSLRGREPRVQTWIQATQIGLDAFVDATEAIAWATSLSDGKPLSGVQLELLTSDGGAAGEGALSREDGMAMLALPRGAPAAMLVGRRDSDVAMLLANTSWYSEGGWSFQPAPDQLRWHVFDDRAMYRPGEEVHVKGWIRRLGGGEDGDVGALRGAAERVSYRVMDPQGSQVGQGSADLSALGGFDLAFTLPEGMNLGYATVEFTAEGGQLAGEYYSHSFQVQEFRRPEFEVKTTPSEGPYFVGDSATIEVSANYFAGGPLPNAEVTWEVTSRTGSFSPPGWGDFVFGVWTPWWGYYEPYYPVQETGQTFVARTDAAGVHLLQIDFESVDPPLPTALTAQATVMDVNRQAWAAQTPLLVHPAALYVGLRSESTFVEREEPLRIEAIVTDLDGRPATGIPITVRAARLDWQLKNGEWVEVEVTPQTCTVRSALSPVQCTFETPEGGEYRITAEVADSKGRRNRTEFRRWVSGAETPPARGVEQEVVTLIPDRKEYQPGDMAEILVQAPFYPAEGVLTLRRSGILSSQRFSLESATTTLKVPIEEAYIPNLYVDVALSGSDLRQDESGEPSEELPPRPAFASGELNLYVPPLSRTLEVSAVPREEKLDPGGETSVEVKVLDASGRPVANAEVAVVIVDEAILALTGYQMADPIATFYTQRGPDAQDYRLRTSVVLGQAEPPQDLALEEGLGRGGGGGAELPMYPAPAAAPQALEKLAVATQTLQDSSAQANAESPIALRTDFNPLAVFAPEVFTDASGRATVAVKLPDNLTRYRVMVTAVASDKYFGKGESAITARLPLMVRPSAPRFLNFGDRFELPVVLQNQTDEAMTVDVAVRASNVVLVGPDGLRVAVPANDRVEVRFPAGTAQAGTARFQVAATSGDSSDASEFSMPVWTPATTEAFATYGVVDEGVVAQPVIAPSDVYTQFGSLKVTTSSTALQELTDAVLYLANYPFECAEQLASRILSVASLRDVLSAFEADGMPTEAELNAAVARDIRRLSGMQNDDGGFGLWRRGDESWPYQSVHAANALQQAKAKGYEVPEETLMRSLNYLQSIESHIPSWYGDGARRAITAYALNVRWRMNDSDAASTRALIAEAGLDGLSFEAIGWILPVLSEDPDSAVQVAEIRRYLNNRVAETASTAHFVVSYGDDGYLLLHSDRRADGVVLDALITDQPDSDLIPKLVRGLLSGRKAGHWANTQEDVFILLALDHYFNTYESVTPDFVARMWLGESYVGESTFEGRSTDYRDVDVPMSLLAEMPGEQELILSKDGQGRLYYRLGLRYAPRDLDMPPAEYGFTVERTYEAVNDPTDVRKDATGAWQIKAGAEVRVKLTMVAPSRRYHVALVDPLPAGLEALNPALAVTGSLPQNPVVEPYWRWWGPWYEHQNLRDERAEAFTSLLWDGVYTYTYYARATTPGEFFVPPAKAEEMYAPETFGRSATDRVIVQ